MENVFWRSRIFQQLAEIYGELNFTRFQLDDFETNHFTFCITISPSRMGKSTFSTRGSACTVSLNC